MRHLFSIRLFVVLGIIASSVDAGDILVDVQGVPDHGVVVARVDLTSAAQWCV